MFVDGASIDAEVHAMSNARASVAEDQVIAIFKIDLYPDLFPGTQIVFMYHVFSHTCVLELATYFRLENRAYADVICRLPPHQMRRSGSSTILLARRSRRAPER